MTKEDNILAEVAAIRCSTDGLRPSKVITHSHTFSLLEINEQAFDEIKLKLKLAGVLDTFYDADDETLILPGVALAKGTLHGECARLNFPKEVNK